MTKKSNINLEVILDDDGVHCHQDCAFMEITIRWGTRYRKCGLFDWCEVKDENLIREASYRCKKGYIAG